MKMKILFGLLVASVVSFFLGLPVDAREKEKRGPREESSSITESSGFDAGDQPQVPPGDFGIQQSCTWWWLYGQHSWSWRGIPGFFVTYNSYGKSWTEYGTSTGGCGIPLVVDRIYVQVTEYPLNSFYTSYDNTAFNTNFVDRGNSGSCFGCPNICGATSFHQATKFGITWSASARSGCATP